MPDKWQGKVEIGFIVPYTDTTDYHLRWLEFQDINGNPLFDILPYAGNGTPYDGAEGMCRAAGQYFVLNLGWDEYDQVCRRMRGSTIRVDLSGIDLGG